MSREKELILLIAKQKEISELAKEKVLIALHEERGAMIRVEILERTINDLKRGLK